ncbi:hypothetical protein L218DRAFT_950158 [Marasmius fiardii PR-910]|nr:hypothetical protein L218DRAFT_950158 [Marasmius fiardii PR-910]
MPKELVARPDILTRRFHPYQRASLHIDHHSDVKLIAQENDPDATLSRFIQALNNLPPYLGSDRAPSCQNATSSRPERRTDDREYSDKQQRSLPPQKKPTVHMPT